MIREIELKQIERKYESFRLKDRNREKYLLSSIREYGIKEPLVVSLYKEEKYVLLDGYKRLRCLAALKTSRIPIIIVGADEADSILYLIRLSNEKTLNILEQAIFVNELKKQFGLSITDIAHRLERSLSWVSVRIGILEGMSNVIREEVFSGRLPVRTYMYTLRQFTRVNKIEPQEVDRFVKAVTGKGLSQRQLDTLAYGFFKGSNELKKQIEKGEIEWTLRQLKKVDERLNSFPSDLTEKEEHFIHDLELFQKYMWRLKTGFLSYSDKNEKLDATARLLVEGILAGLKPFEKELQVFYDTRKYS